MAGITKTEIETLFLQHYQEWCLLSFSYIKDMDAAEDLVQDVIVKLLSMPNNNIQHLERYIKVMVRNASITKGKHLSKLIPLDLEIPDKEHLDDDPMPEAALSQKIIFSLESLPEQRRKVVELCVVQGVKYETAANELGISINTVKYHLKKAFKSLRSSLGMILLMGVLMYIFYFSIYFF